MKALLAHWPVPEPRVACEIHKVTSPHTMCVCLREREIEGEGVIVCVCVCVCVCV